MNIRLEHISKRFLKYWIFKDVNHTFTGPGAYALLGSNGSGKSTLLRIIAGMQTPSLGKVYYSGVAEPGKQARELAGAEIFSHFAFCAPGMELVEELTLQEFFEFHFSFKRQRYPIDRIITITGLENARHKPLGDYSSGMKQRVKLAQAIFADTPILLLDEPCTNLDQHGMDQYRDWIADNSRDRLVIVASNDAREYFFCNNRLDIEDYK